MKLYSNEIVFRGHPDKVCDQISDAILDECLKQDVNTRCGIEVMGGKGKIFVTGEVTTKAIINLENIVKRVLKDVGYDTNYEIINNLGLSEVMNNDVNLLSGGEMQRVSIARALVNNPHLLLCDEPTGNLDNVNKELIMDMLTRLNNEGMTVIIVTHDLNIAKRCHRHYLLTNGRLQVVTQEK